MKRYKEVHDLGSHKLPEIFILEPKYDGQWITLVRRGDSVQCWSRSGLRKKSLMKKKILSFFTFLEQRCIRPGRQWELRKENRRLLYD